MSKLGYITMHRINPGVILRRLRDKFSGETYPQLTGLERAAIEAALNGSGVPNARDRYTAHQARTLIRMILDVV